MARSLSTLSPFPGSSVGACRNHDDIRNQTGFRRRQYLCARPISALAAQCEASDNSRGWQKPSLQGQRLYGQE